jgi:FkbM family methyltransferase
MRHPTKPDSFTRLKRMGLPIRTILDVGVQSATPELRDAFGDIKHLLFEPLTEWNEQISRAYAQVPHELLNIAVSDRVGNVTLELQSTIKSIDIPSHARIKDIAPGMPSRIVPTSTLDAIVNVRDLDKPFLLKIDVDGAELMILSGATETLKSCSVVVIEAQIGNFTERSKILEDAGFELFDIVDLAYYDDRMVQFDLVFVNAALIKSMKLGLYVDGFDYEKWRTYLPT